MSGSGFAAVREPAQGLAALRCAVAVIILASPELHRAPRLAGTVESLVASPEGLGWLASWAGPPAWLVSAVHVVACSAGATALLGYRSRASCAVLCVASTYLISFSQRLGATQHDMHLLWLLALLAVSPCGDVWSLDAWGKGRPPASVEYGVPLTLARLLLGFVYLFPGIHKILDNGLAWASAQNLSAIMYGKWFQEGRVPLLRPDGAPLLLTVGGACVLFFELSFIVLALAPPTRLVALALGLSFHAATRCFLFISFPSLWACYVVLLPWAWLLRRFGSRAESEPVGTWATLAKRCWPSLAVGAVLIIGAASAGIRGKTQAFPFACYPTFSGQFVDTAPDLVVELIGREGGELRLERSFGRRRTQKEWRQVYWLLGAYGGTPTDASLRSYARELARSRDVTQTLERATRVRFLYAEYATSPKDWGKPPKRARVIRELSP